VISRRFRRGLVIVLGLVALAFVGLSVWGVTRRRPKPLLEVFEEVAQREKRPEFRAAALVELAWAESEAGDVAKARELVREVVVDSTPEGAWTGARLAALTERVNGRGAGRKLFESVFGAIEAAPKASAMRGATTAWFEAIAHSPGAVPRGDPLVDRAFALIEKSDDGFFGEEVATGLASLGGTERVRALALRRLEANRSWFAPLAAIDSRCVLGPRESWKVLERAYFKPEELFDDFTAFTLVPALRGRPSPWETALTLAADLEVSGHKHEANVARLAGLIRLSELDERSFQGDRIELVLEAALAEAQLSLRGADLSRRLDVLMRTISLVPSFELGERGIELVRRAEKQAAAAVPGDGERVLQECIAAAHRLSPRREARALEEECGHDALAGWVAHRKGRPVQETGRLGRCVLGSAVRLGSERGRALLKEVVTDLLGPSTHDKSEPSAIMECAYVAGRLGDGDLARRLFEQSFSPTAPGPGGWDPIVALRATKGLERELRDEVAARVVHELERTKMDLDVWRRLFAAVAEVDGSPVDPAGN
jgi:hypothetical protein